MALGIIVNALVTSLLAGIQFTVFTKTLDVSEIPKRWFATFGTWIAAAFQFPASGYLSTSCCEQPTRAADPVRMDTRAICRSPWVRSSNSLVSTGKYVG